MTEKRSYCQIEHDKVIDLDRVVFIRFCPSQDGNQVAVLFVGETGVDHYFDVTPKMFRYLKEWFGFQSE